LIPQLSLNFHTQVKELKLPDIRISRLLMKEKLEIYKIISIVIVPKSSSKAVHKPLLWI